MQRIVSFLPSATEMVAALGLTDQLIGITHECDFPPAVSRKPVVVRSAIPTTNMSQSAIDAVVRERLQSGASLYEVDEALLQKLAPDLIITQNLCQVCAPSGNEVSQVLRLLPGKPEVLYLTPQSLADIFDNLRSVGRATGTSSAAERLIEGFESRLSNVRQITLDLTKPRVFFMEWIDPIFCGGHWVPEMINLAGGFDALGQLQSDSVRVTWEDVRKFDPEIMIVAPCGFNLQQVIGHAQSLPHFPGGQIWQPFAPAVFLPWTPIPISRARARGWWMESNYWHTCSIPTGLVGTALPTRLRLWRLRPDLLFDPVGNLVGQ